MNVTYLLNQRTKELLSCFDSEIKLRLNQKDFVVWLKFAHKQLLTILSPFISEL